MLIVRNLNVHLGRSHTLRDVDFTAKAGEVTAIVGPNGSGKTTLLRAISGDVGFAGTVTIEGLDVQRVKPWALAERRGVLAQSTTVAFPFTVAEIVQLGQRDSAPGMSRNLTERALGRVGLSGFGPRRYHDLSGGEQQRVQLARVLCQIWEPVGPDGANWLILDEPVASLDIAHQLEVMTLARDYAQAGGGVVAVMHDLNLTAMFAQSIALLSQGRVVAQGGVDEVLTDDRLGTAYGCRLRVNTAPTTTFILPQAAAL
ncbi:heme ABC transporter ATP-binding protein [Maritimibacter sp. DP1N21-5]|uniref:heme ABC transporter ATP-binding protein n=1 Tax=Maritimibacter sp. DP1N21-5 TaxID=2836867 RepID=UPI001C45A0E6|nr:heme ABC transporter ATP-binding protein [Maritimibacter sp. DP1N21-5]MBV7407698.1 heme ABC transporter ATP-binding protein [Maritimibacter sp. DP1N21-5]